MVKVGFLSSFNQLSETPLDIVDVGDIAALDGFRNEVEGLLQSPGLNILLNNAGIHIRKDLQQSDGDMLMENFRINVAAPFSIAKVDFIASVY